MAPPPPRDQMPPYIRFGVGLVGAPRNACAFWKNDVLRAVMIDETWEAGAETTPVFSDCRIESLF